MGRVIFIVAICTRLTSARLALILSVVAVRGLEIRQSVPVAGDLFQFRMAIVRVRQAKLADFG